MIPGPDESRIPTAAPAVLDQASRVGLFINAAAMIGFGSPPISHLLGPLQGARVVVVVVGGGVQNIPECCCIYGLLKVSILPLAF